MKSKCKSIGEMDHDTAASQLRGPGLKREVSVENNLTSARISQSASLKTYIWELLDWYA